MAFAENGTDANILLVIDNSQPKGHRQVFGLQTRKWISVPILGWVQGHDKTTKKQNHGKDYYEIKLQLDGKKFKKTLPQYIRKRVCKFNFQV